MVTLQWFEFVPTEYEATIAGNVNGEGGWGATMIFFSEQNRNYDAKCNWNETIMKTNRENEEWVEICKFWSETKRYFLVYRSRKLVYRAMTAKCSKWKLN